MDGTLPGRDLPRRPRRSFGRVGFTTIVAALVLVVVLGTAAAAPLAKPAKVTYKAPFEGTELGVVGVEQAGCDNGASSSVLPSFNLTTGVARESGKDWAKSCGSSNSTVDVGLIANYYGTSFTTSTGSHNLTATWILHLNVSLAATSTALRQLAYASVSVEVTTLVEDETNGTVYSSGATVAIDHLLGADEGALTYAHTFSKVVAAASVVANLVKGHTYDLTAEVEVLLETLSMPGSNSATASANMGTGSYGATLRSVTLS